ncbi:hypothetical protein V8F33_010124 [Rhypophila sp. PSN 637]
MGQAITWSSLYGTAPNQNDVRPSTERSGLHSSLSRASRRPLLSKLGASRSPSHCRQLPKRHVDDDLYYKGYVIPAGTAINFWTFLQHYDENVFPSPWTFRPRVEAVPWESTTSVLRYRSAVEYAKLQCTLIRTQIDRGQAWSDGNKEDGHLDVMKDWPPVETPECGDVPTGRTRTSWSSTPHLPRPSPPSQLERP